ncbi:hypothetical protein F52700_11753 [Fusarium sp. NRRL 52700]|nr:hypothetical protein F52700_11753 [Fusarium sp. NRRL 52700]
MYGDHLTDSPYRFSTVKIIFGDDSTYWIPVYLLERYPRFRLSYNKPRDVVKLNWLDQTQTADFMDYLRNGTWKSRKPEDLDGSPDYYNRMQQCLSVYGLALDYGMGELARLAFGEFTSMAVRLSVFDLMKMLQEANWALQSSQNALANYFAQRATMTEEAIMADLIARFEGMNTTSRTFTNITLAEVSEMKRKLQQYQERYGSL